MIVTTIRRILRPQIAEQTHVGEIRSDRQELKRAFLLVIQWCGIRPDPAYTMLLQEMNDSRQMPPVIAELDRKSHALRQRSKESAECSFVRRETE